jgi:hypothetical protein
MREGKLRRIFFAGVFIAVLLLTAACTDGLALTPSSIRQAHAFPVDTTFKEFYQTLGGNELLGPAISPLEIRDNLQCQYTERVLMCLNPAATGVGRFRLYPLGLELNIQEDSHISAISASTKSRVVDGIVIHEKFLPLYDRLYGARYVGRPLTEVRINQDLHRAEQFFENAGFYQDLSDPNGPVFLIPYGAYLCGGDCSYRLNEYWSIVKSNLTEQPFAPSIARLGGPGAFGSLLLKPRVAEDGLLEQVYANVAFAAPQDDPSQVHLRQLPIVLGYEVQPLVAMKKHEQLVFYEIKDGLGHNVPRPFDNFVASHGGRDLAGQPISEVVLLKDQNVYRQCFENYCLIYDPAASDALKVRMAPLGQEYVNRFPPPEDVQIRNVFSPENLALLVTADKPTINDNEPQYIRIMIRQKESGQPLERVEATLVLNYQNSPSIRYFLPPSDVDGMAVVEIPPQPGLANGTRLSYQVCLNLPSEQPICAMGSYLIWNVQ